MFNSGTSRKLLYSVTLQEKIHNYGHDLQKSLLWWSFKWLLLSLRGLLNIALQFCDNSGQICYRIRLDSCFFPPLISNLELPDDISPKLTLLSSAIIVCKITEQPLVYRLNTFYLFVILLYCIAANLLLWDYKEQYEKQIFESMFIVCNFALLLS